MVRAGAVVQVVERRVVPAVLAAVLAVLATLVAAGSSSAAPLDRTLGPAGGSDPGRGTAASSMAATAVRSVAGARTTTAVSRSSRGTSAPALARPLGQAASGGGHPAPGPALPALGGTVLLASLLLGLAIRPRHAPLTAECRCMPFGRAPPVTFGS